MLEYTLLTAATKTKGPQATIDAGGRRVDIEHLGAQSLPDRDTSVPHEAWHAPWNTSAKRRGTNVHQDGAGHEYVQVDVVQAPRPSQP